MLTAEQIAEREGKLTASRIACLMKGDTQAIHDLWRELIGDPAIVPDMMRDVWPVRLGEITEELNLEWFERKHGPVERRGVVVVNDQFDWAACTLDGWSENYKCPIECKHCGGFEDLADIIERYQPQMQWQMLVTAAPTCAFSVIFGAKEPLVEFIPFADDYAALMWARAEQFMACVRSMTPPVDLPPIAPPVVPEKTYDFSTSNRWVSEATAWVMTRSAAKDHTAAEKALKELVPEDAIRVTGGGIECKRNRAGSLSIKEKAA